jgi:hypothetical protein
MERAEFQIDHQDPGAWLGPDDVMRNLQSVDGGGAAHEPYHGALDGGIEP